MSSINRFQTLIIALAVILGLLLGKLPSAGIYAEYLIVPFLMLMLFGLFLNIPVKDLLKSFSNLRFFSASVAVNFIWTPIFAYFLGSVFLQEELSLWIGLVMLLVTPCTDWYLIFTGIAKGNLPLSASILPLNLVLQVLLLPIYLLFFFGRTGSVEVSTLLESIVLVLLVPFVLAQLVRYLAFQQNRREFFSQRLLPFFDTGQVVFLALTITAMFASQGEYLIGNPEIILKLLLPLLLFFIGNFFVGRLLAALLKFSYADSASLNLTTLARNSPISLAIAVTAFPNDPLIALALVIGPLIELPVLMLVSQVLLKMRSAPGKT